MGKVLTTDILRTAGFVDAGFWSVTDDRLVPPAPLPAERGVYAFAIDQRVLYVGLASRSIQQRLNFYCRPGKSQTTNIRLNGLIRERLEEGLVVRALIAHPKDSAWNGLRISGPEGLEAALIEDFEIPWNLKGSTSIDVDQDRTSSLARPARGTASKAIAEFVARNPHATELQIAKGVFGPDAVQPRANAYCRRLVETGVLERLPTRPATYIIRK